MISRRPTAINVEELARAVRPRGRSSTQDLIRRLLVIPLQAREGWQAGSWRQSFAARGSTLSQADCLIAAAALTADATLVTGTPKDFPMREIRVEHWPVGQ